MTSKSKQGAAHHSFAAQINKTIIGIWLGASLITSAIEAMVIATGVGTILDWVLLSVFAGFCIVLALQLFDKNPILIVTEVGVHDKRLSRRLIPWRDMLWHRLVEDDDNPILAVGLTDAMQKKHGILPWTMLFKNQVSPFGKSKGYRVWPRRTRGDVQEFMKTVKSFMPKQG